MSVELYEIEGGASGEAELGMQLYEDFYINKNYGGGAGPGQGGFWDQWHNHELEREFQLMTGGHFLFGVDKMNATSGMSGNSYELVDNGYDTYSNVNASQDENGEWHGGMSIKHVDLSYYRLVPGSGSPVKGLSFLRDSGGGYPPKWEPVINDIVRAMLTDKCTKAFKDAGLKSPKELLETGVVIGPSTLLWNDSASNLKYMGITEFARNLNAAGANNHGTNAVTIWDHEGKIPDTVDGRPRIFLNSVAFDDDLGEAVRHEFIHAAGKEGREEMFGHDLQYMGYTDIKRWGGGGKWPYTEHRKTGVTYDDIQEACR